MQVRNKYSSFVSDTRCVLWRFFVTSFEDKYRKRSWHSCEDRSKPPRPNSFVSFPCFPHGCPYDWTEWWRTDFRWTDQVFFLLFPWLMGCEISDGDLRWRSVSGPFSWRNSHPLSSDCHVPRVPGMAWHVANSLICEILGFCVMIQALRNFSAKSGETAVILRVAKLLLTSSRK